MKESSYNSQQMASRPHIPDATPIWRYMDVARFALLVLTGKVWFTKVRHLLKGDPYEAYGDALGGSDFVLEHGRQYEPEIMGMALHGEVGRLAAKDVKEAADRLFVSSWCMGPESLGMWMLYGANGTGVAVRSTVGQFKAALVQNLHREQYTFGAVEYHEDVTVARSTKHDFRRGPAPASGTLWKLVQDLGFNKRVAYDYEREWRAVIFQEERPEEVSGLDIDVDLEGLVADVFLGPHSGELELVTVTTLIQRAGLQKVVTRSSLLSYPQRT